MSYNINRGYNINNSTKKLPHQVKLLNCSLLPNQYMQKDIDCACFNKYITGREISLIPPNWTGMLNAQSMAPSLLMQIIHCNVKLVCSLLHCTQANLALGLVDSLRGSTVQIKVKPDPDNDYSNSLNLILVMN